MACLAGLGRREPLAEARGNNGRYGDTGAATQESGQRGQRSGATTACPACSGRRKKYKKPCHGAASVLKRGKTRRYRLFSDR